MPDVTIQAIEGSQRFRALSPVEQDQVRQDYLRSFIFSDPGWSDLPTETKAKVANRVMGITAPKGFWSALFEGSEVPESPEGFPPTGGTPLAGNAPATPAPVMRPAPPRTTTLTAMPDRTIADREARMKRGGIPSLPVTLPHPTEQLAATSPARSATPEEQAATDVTLRRMGSVVAPPRTAWQSMTESRPGLAITTGLTETPEGQLVRIFAGSGVTADTVETLREELGANPTLLDKTLQSATAILASPINAVSFLAGPVAVPAKAMAASLTRLFGKAGAAATVRSAMAGTSFATFEAVNTALRQTAHAQATGQPASVGELAAAAGRGALTGAVLGPTAAIPGAILRKAAEVGVFATVPPALEGRTPTVEDAIDAGLIVTALGLAHALPRHVLSAIEKPRSARTAQEQAAVDGALRTPLADLTSPEPAEGQPSLPETMAELQRLAERTRRGADRRARSLPIPSGQPSIDQAVAELERFATVESPEQVPTLRDAIVGALRQAGERPAPAEAWPRERLLQSDDGRLAKVIVTRDGRATWQEITNPKSMRKAIAGAEPGQRVQVPAAEFSELWSDQPGGMDPAILAENRTRFLTDERLIETTRRARAAPPPTGARLAEVTEPTPQDESPVGAPWGIPEPIRQTVAAVAQTPAPEAAEPSITPTGAPVSPTPAPEPTPTPKTEPPIRSGFLRLYHAEGGPASAGQTGHWFTSNPQRAVSFGQGVSYVDVPNAVARTARTAARKGGSGTATDHFLADEWMNKAQPVGWTVTAPVYDIGGAQASEVPGIPAGQLGSVSAARTERGTEVETRFALVEAEQPVTSHTPAGAVNPAYDQTLQGRDRTRAASREQVQATATSLHAPWLGDSPKASEGAPIVGRDLQVESGNNRVNAIRLAYQTNAPTAQAYRIWLTDHAATFGFTPEAVQGMTRPMLVRVRQTAVDRATFARESNEQSLATLSPVERAIGDARALTPGLLSRFVPNESGLIATPENAEFLRAFLQEVVPARERGAYLTADGQLSQEGVLRIRNALFSKVFGNPSAVARLSEDLDNNVKNVTAGLVNAIPKLARMQADIESGTRYPLDIAPDVATAMEKLAALRASGQTVQAYLKQRGLFGDDLTPLQKDILDVFSRNGRSAVRIWKILDSYADAVDTLGSPQQRQLFGAITPKAHDVFATAVRYVESGHADIASLLRGETVRGLESVQPPAQGQGQAVAEAHSAAASGPAHAAGEAPNRPYQVAARAETLSAPPRGAARPAGGPAAVPSEAPSGGARTSQGDVTLGSLAGALHGVWGFLPDSIRTLPQRWEQLVERVQNRLANKLPAVLRQARGLGDVYVDLLHDKNAKIAEAIEQAVSLAGRMKTGLTRAQRLRLDQVLRGGITTDPKVAAAVGPARELILHYERKLIEYGYLTPEDVRTFAEKFRTNPEYLRRLYEAKLLQPEGKIVFTPEHTGVADVRSNIFKERGETRTVTLPYSGGEPLVGRDREAFLARYLDQGYRLLRVDGDQATLFRDIPEAIRKRMGELRDEPAFVAAKTIAEQARVVANHEFLDAIRQNPEWARDSLTPEELASGRWTRLPGDRAKWGPLADSFVTLDVAKEVAASITLRGEWQKIHDRLIGMWKYGKVVANPAAMSRNVMSSAILADFGGLHPWRADAYGASLRELVHGTGYVPEARHLGLFRAGYHQNEINTLATRILASPEQNVLLRTLDGLSARVQQAGQTTKVSPSRLYGAIENFYRYSLYRYGRAELGMDPTSARRYANKYAIDYEVVSPAIRLLRKLPIGGAPFATFSSQAIPLTLETLAKHPLRVLKWPALIYGVSAFAAGAIGQSEEETRAQRLLGDLGQVRYALLPQRDKDGRAQYLDLGYILPFGDLLEMVDAIEGGPGRRAHISVLPLVSNPAMAVSELLLNRQSFTGKDILRPSDTTAADRVQRYITHLAQQWGPSWIPPVPGVTKEGGYAYEDLRRAFSSPPETDFLGRTRSPGSAVMANLAGLRAKGVTLAELADFRLREVERQLAGLEGEALRIAARLRQNPAQRGTELSGIKAKMQEVVREAQQWIPLIPKALAGPRPVGAAPVVHPVPGGA